MGNCAAVENKNAAPGADTAMTLSLSSATDAYEKAFGEKATSGGVAPGRVNLIGEHTDYNDGLVLPYALPLNTAVVGAKNNSNKIRINSANKGTTVEFDVDDFNKMKDSEEQWVNYIKGLLKEFAAILPAQAKDSKKQRRKSIKGGRKSSVSANDIPAEVPAKLPGFNATIVSTVPLGGGLSSSAALVVAFACFLEELTKVNVNDTERAEMCHRAECNYVAKVGTMDQIASIRSKEGHFTLIDCKDNSVKHVSAAKLSDHVIVITNSGVKHDIADGKYAERRSECEKAAKVLGVKSLRDAKLKDVENKKEKLGDLYKRAKHVVTENERVEAAAKAVAEGKVDELGELMNKSHDSLQNDYEVSCAEVDFLVSTARKIKGVKGARMTGGGFGGCMITVVHKSMADKLIQTLEKKYKSTHKKTASSFVCEPTDGAQSFDLGVIEGAATKIQAVFRGNLARKQTEKKTEKKGKK